MRNLFTIILIAVVMTNISNSQTDEINSKLDSLFSKYNTPNPGAAVEIISQGKVIFKKGFGFANVEDKIPIDLQTNFRLASVTKQFTATAVLLLIERGKLSFNEKLTDLFPGFPKYGEKITIKNLLNHTSGLIDYEDLIPDTVTIQVTDSDVLKSMMKQDSTYFEPGTKWQYSNTGYALLSLIS